jgi:secreted PhoX family phosphatase
MKLPVIPAAALAAALLTFGANAALLSFGANAAERAGTSFKANGSGQKAALPCRYRTVKPRWWGQCLMPGYFKWQKTSGK